MNKKENGTIGFCDSPPATCPLDPSPARRQWKQASLLVLALSWLGEEGFSKGFRFNPATGSPTATLLRLHPSRRPHRGMRQ
ncbi:hypothetical protein POPTR_007G062041v4 [Populus trichocarpa]|uniref:Uncharacterized protein n=1 Tax=Populus trichocarpa TaxID=3694 RepID=A0ACC0SPS8_POPTR|nr:hypothetical protein BDE02_07G060000 [Populus trichocarpa]KAI9391233.1 hypothetical protein POPTR_007G062041v4 [Populus trichocarpa]